MKKLSFIKKSSGSHWVGDGFPVRSIFSYQDIAEKISPFLMMDYGGPTKFEPTKARRGVGEHPHRGFETVTIVYDGEVEHRDSSGGGGKIGRGDVQWMTAASGLVHEEYHGTEYAKKGGPFEMIQLWVNLPAKDKMGKPGYQGLMDAQIPRVELEGGAGRIRVIAGEYRDHRGPARTHTPMNVWDIKLNAAAPLEFKVPAGHTAAVFVLRGEIQLPSGEMAGEAALAVLEREGDTVGLTAGPEGATLLFLGGQPLGEPIVGYGPFVMNTREQIVQAFEDYQAGRMGRVGG